MSEQIDCGEGWRWLRPDDVVSEEDEVWLTTCWVPVYEEIVGYRPSGLLQVRRRVPSKPEPIKIRHTLIKCNSFNDVMRVTNQDVSLLVGSAIEARQLADWLIRYADWREAQNL